MLRRHGNYDMRRVIAELAASTRRDRYVTVVQERLPLLSSNVGQHQVVPLQLLAVRAVMTERLDYWANHEVAPALCRVLDVSQNEYKICDNCCAAQPLDKKGNIPTRDTSEFRTPPLTGHTSSLSQLSHLWECPIYGGACPY